MCLLIGGVHLAVGKKTKLGRVGSAGEPRTRCRNRIITSGYSEIAFGHRLLLLPLPLELVTLSPVWFEQMGVSKNHSSFSGLLQIWRNYKLEKWIGEEKKK